MKVIRNNLNRYDKQIMIIKEYLFLLIIIYMMTRRLWEQFIGEFYKNFSFLLIVLGIFLYCINNIIRIGFRRNEKLDKITKILLIIFICYICYILFNGIYFGNIARLFKGIKEYIIYPLVTLSCIFYLKKVNKYDNILKVITIMGLVVSVLSIYEFMSGTPILPLEIDPNNKTRYYLVYESQLIFRARTFFGSFQVNGLILSMCALININSFITKKKIIYILMFILNFIGLNCSCARGPLVALIIALLFVFTIHYYSSIRNVFQKLNKTNKTLLIISLLLIAIILLCIIIFNITFGISSLEFFFQRIRSIFNWTSTENSNTTRMNVWGDSLKIFLKNPLIGIGIASTGSGDLGTISIGVTESGILKRLVETGVIGFLLYYLIFFLLFLGNYKKFMKRIVIFIRENSLYLSIILAIFIEDITLQITEDYAISFFLYFFIALMCLKSNFLVFKKEDNL